MLALLVAWLATITVNAGGNVQTAFNNALPGDVIEIEAGATFTANFSLPAKTNPHGLFITVRSASLATLPRSRFHPSHAALLPKLQANSGIILTNADAASHWRFQGIEFSAPTNVKLLSLVSFGDNETVMSNIPRYMEFDRCYFHGDPAKGARRGLLGDVIGLRVTRSWFDHFKDEIGPDTQGIWMYNTPGPAFISDNYIEGAGENFFIGAADPQIAGMIPSDIVFTKNTVFKPYGWNIYHPTFGLLDSDALTTTGPNTLSSTGTSVSSTAHGIIDAHFIKLTSGPQAGEIRQVATIPNGNSVTLVTAFSQNQSAGTTWKKLIPWWKKNSLELKMGVRVTMTGNTVEHDWADGQYVAVNFKSENQNGGATWIKTAEVNFSNNIIRRTKAAIVVSGIAGAFASVIAHDITIRNNVFIDTGWVYSGPVSDTSPRSLSIQTRATRVTATHNVFQCEVSECTAYYVDSPTNKLDTPVVKDNVFKRGTYGLKGPGFGEGTASLNGMATSPVFTGNVWADDGADLTGYPSGNFQEADFESLFRSYPNDFRLALGSPYIGAGTDGKDIGVDWDELLAATSRRRTRWR